jgi:hypothetical protein
LLTCLDTTFPFPIDVIFKSATEEKRLPLLRPLFPQLTAKTIAEVDLAFAAGSAEDKETSGAAEGHNLAQARSLWFSQIVVRLDPMTKQPVQRMRDFTAEFRDAIGTPRSAFPALSTPSTSSPTPGPFSTAAASATPAGPAAAEVGALLLRGPRCVLVRCLEDPPTWPGMRLPSLPALPNESAHDTAVRAVSDLCAVLDSEYVPVDIPPLCVYKHGACIPLHVFYARSPAAALYNQDREHPDELWDWFTLSRALARVDDSTQRALRAAAYAIDAAAHVWRGCTRVCVCVCVCVFVCVCLCVAPPRLCSGPSSTLVSPVQAGRVQVKWGGLFGQEMVANAPVLHDDGDGKEELYAAPGVSGGAEYHQARTHALDPFCALNTTHPH